MLNSAKTRMSARPSKSAWGAFARHKLSHTPTGDCIRSVDGDSSAKTGAAECARNMAGLTLKQAAHRARISEPYLRRIERHGNAPYALATRLADLYCCSIHLFL